MTPPVLRLTFLVAALLLLACDAFSTFRNTTASSVDTTYSEYPESDTDSARVSAAHANVSNSPEASAAPDDIWASSSAVSCPGEDWLWFNGRCYWRSSCTAPWDNITALCQLAAPGARPVSVHSDQENYLLHALVEGDTWIGLRRHGRCDWSWSDGSPLDLNRVGSASTSPVDQCAYIPGDFAEGHGKGYWLGRQCEAELFFVCQTDEKPCTAEYDPVALWHPQGRTADNTDQQTTEAPWESARDPWQLVTKYPCRHRQKHFWELTTGPWGPTTEGLWGPTTGSRWGPTTERSWGATRDSWETTSDPQQRTAYNSWERSRDPWEIISEAPSNSRTRGLWGPTTGGPWGPPTGSPWRRTTEGPWGPTTGNIWRRTTEGPWGPTTGRPWRRTTEGPWGPATGRPWRRTTEGPWGPTGRPWRRTTEGPWGPTTVRSWRQTTEGPWGPTTGRPWRRTTEGPWRPTTGRSWERTEPTRYPRGPTTNDPCETAEDYWGPTEYPWGPVSKIPWVTTDPSRSATSTACYPMTLLPRYAVAQAERQSTGDPDGNTAAAEDSTVSTNTATTMDRGGGNDNGYLQRISGFRGFRKSQRYPNGLHEVGESGEKSTKASRRKQNQRHALSKVVTSA